jgi:hypothetical protein
MTASFEEIQERNRKLAEYLTDGHTIFSYFVNRLRQGDILPSTCNEITEDDYLDLFFHVYHYGRFHEPQTTKLPLLRRLFSMKMKYAISVDPDCGVAYTNDEIEHDIERLAKWTWGLTTMHLHVAHTIGGALEIIRRRHVMTHEDMQAIQGGMTLDAIRMLEHQSTDPKWSAVMRYLEACDSDVEELMKVYRP